MIREEESLSISKVVEKLKSLYPDLTVSKIRFLENEGLIKPKRTKSGYRKFSPQDIERLQLILKFQKEHFYPLHVIREKLNSLDEGKVTLEEIEMAEEEAVSSLKDISEVMDLDEAVKITQLSPETIEALENFNIVSSTETPKGKSYEPIEIEVMKITAELEQFGIEPRHLRIYQNFVEKEALLFDQILLPLMKQRSHEGKKKASEALTKLVRLSSDLRRILLHKSLRQYFKELI